MRGTVHRKDIRHGASALEDADSRLLRAVLELQSRFIAEHDSGRAFVQTLACLLELTESEYGFISELEHDEDGALWLRSLAITDLAWNETTREFFASRVQSGVEFRNLENLFGEVVKTGQVVISNDRENDPRSAGIPEGHPPLKSFLGIPFRFNGELVGMLGIANRKSEYSEDLVNWLEPLTDACSTMVAAVHAERERNKAAEELKASEEHFRRIAELTTEVTFVGELDAHGVVHVTTLLGNLQQVLGVTREALLDTGWQTFIHSDDLPCNSELLKEIEESDAGQTRQHVIRWTRPDGETRKLQVTAWIDSNLLSTSEPPTRRIEGCVVDITASIRSERALREIAQRNLAILQAVPDLMFLMTKDGRFVEAWAEDESMLVAPADQLVGQRHRDLLPAEICDQWDHAVCELNSGEEVSTFEYSLLIEDETRWFEARVVDCGDATGSILTVSRDITERRDAEEAEARQFALLKEISRNARELIFVKDVNRRYLFLNEATAKVIGAPVEDILGRTNDELFPQSAARMTAESDRKVLDRRQSVICEQTLPAADGARHFLTSKSPWLDRTGEVVGIIAIAQDVTELLEINRELSRSREFVERIAEASPHILYVFDIVDQQYIYSNRQIARDLGYGPEEIRAMGKEFLPLTLHPDDLAKAPTLLARWETAQDGEIFEQEYRMRAASGEWRWFLARDTAFRRDEDGRVRQIIGTAQDISDRIHAQHSLQESEARLRAIIESEPECVKLVSRDGTLLEMNSAGLRFTGAESLEDVVGRCVFDLIAPEFQQPFREFHEKVCGGEAGTLEMEIIGLTGERRRMETHAVPLKYGPDGEIGHLAITRDVTDVRKAEELIAEHQSQLLHVSRLSSLGQMAAAIAHEITQPLSAISNYAAACRLLLKREQPDLGTFSRHIETIAAQTHRAGETLDRIRTFIRGGSSPKRSCDIGEVITGALDLMKAELRNRQVRVEFDSSRPLPPVMADRIQIQQVITNLVTNACDAMQPLPKHERSVNITCQQNSVHIVIKVEDTGPGLNDLSQETLFEAFSTSKSEGMGLGLAICRDIVTAHGGTIVAANARTRGAVFQFTLPVSKEA